MNTGKPEIICNTGEYAPDSKDCGSYFRCVLGELRREQCAPGLHWDARRDICDWPSTAKCQQGLGNMCIQLINCKLLSRTVNGDLPFIK